MRCVRCKSVRGECSFYADNSHPSDVCKPCIHRPRRAHVRALRNQASRSDRTQAAIRYVVKHAQANTQPFVYLVGVGRNVKIGFSTNVNKRIRQLETASSSPVQLIAVAPGSRQLEQELHDMFVGLRIRLEWFRNNNNLITQRFAALSGSMVFLPGYVKQDAPLDAIE